jgi:hypothetical protein
MTKIDMNAFKSLCGALARCELTGNGTLPRSSCTVIKPSHVIAWPRRRTGCSFRSRQPSAQALIAAIPKFVAAKPDNQHQIREIDRGEHD